MASTEQPKPSTLRKTSQALRHDTVIAEQQAMSLAREFKAFILRGNVVDLAIAVVIGAAFSGVVTALVNDMITPLIAIFGVGTDRDFAKATFTIHGSVFKYGDFINNSISFLIIAAVVFFFVVKPINSLLAMRRAEVEPPPETTTRDCPYCLNAIPALATRCGFCTSPVTATQA